MPVAAPPLAGRTIQAGGYAVTIGASLRDLGASVVADASPAHRFAIVSDDTVGPLYGRDLTRALGDLGQAALYTVPAGERHKSRESWASLSDQLLADGCGRDTTVVALGGGVVGDLAGFVAATYMRGVPVVQCPTSLLAMIDASVGGKTGVDTPAGKNLVGAFHPPAAVVADVATIRSLPLSHRRAGLAEAIKHGVIADADYFAWLDGTREALLDAEPGALLHCVARSVEIKSGVVGDDPFEQGRRRILNFGHTLGHALETVSGFTLLHGDAVAIGMVLEARLAERVGVATAGLAEAVLETVRRAGLPTSRPRDLDPAAVLEATARDKKRVGGAVGYALPAGVGRMAGAANGWLVPVDAALVREVLA